jgi:hypothetical protein
MPPDHAIESLAIRLPAVALRRAYLREYTPGPLPRNDRPLSKVWSNASVPGKSLTLLAALLYFPLDLTSSFLH